MIVCSRSLGSNLIGELEANVRSLRAVLNGLVNELDSILRRSSDILVNSESHDVG